MPDYRDRYTDRSDSERSAARRPETGTPQRRPAPQNTRPEGYSQQLRRPATQNARPVGSSQPPRRPAPQSTRPERYSQQPRRPAMQNARPEEYSQQPRRPAMQNARPEGYSQPPRRPATQNARPEGSSQPPRRPAPQKARPDGYSQPQRRPAPQNARPDGYSQPQRRPAPQPPRRPAEPANRFSKAARRAPRQPISLQLPPWARLGLVALVFLLLIALSVKAISSLSARDDRTVITPHTNETQAPLAENTDTPLNEPTDEPTAEPDDTAGDLSQQVTPTNQVSQTTSGGRSATIRMAGDIVIDTEMLEACYDKASDSYDFVPYLSLIGDTLSRSDYTMINLDASLRKGKYGYSGYPMFTTPPSILQVVKNVGVDMITMCNNHMLDAYCDGLVESVGHVDAAGLDHIGGYVDEADSNTPEIYTINGIRVGFVSYTHSTNTMEQYCDERSEFLVKRFKNANFQADVNAVRAAGAEVVVAVAHWGDEYKRAPDFDQQYWAKKLVAAGVDLIIGGHPHMVQPAEYITATDASGASRTALCVYSIGNFLTQHRTQYTDSGIVFEFTLTEQADGTFAVTDPGYVPVYVWTFKNAAGNDDYRVLPTGACLSSRPEGMSDDQYLRMQETWNETLEVMGGDTVIRALSN